MSPFVGFLVLLFLVTTGVLLIVVIVDRILSISLKKKIALFNESYNLLSLGMSKQQVIDLLGDNYTKSATMDIETLCWSCNTNTSIQRELYSKKETKLIITVEFSNNNVIGYKMK